MTDSYGSNAPVRRRGRDRGQTFVEILVSIVLLGTAVGGTLTALRTTIISSEIDEAQAKAQALLLASQDALYRATYYSCADTGPGPDPDPGIDAGEIQDSYEAAINAVPKPSGWNLATIEISSLQFWQKSDGTEIWDPICQTDSSVRRSAQLIEIYVLSPTGDVGKRIQVVKDGS